MSSYSLNSLPKGQACLDCRQRCDSGRPICGPCTRAERFEDCEYGDEESSNIQKLEDSISRIQIRIKDLENPNRPSSVRLRNPYTGSGNCQSQEHSPSACLYLFYLNTVLTDPGSRSTSERTVTQMLRLALDTFTPYANEVGFFLNQKRFQNTCLCMGGGHSEELPPALLNSVCLWAACLSSSEPLASQEGHFLSRALKKAPAIISSTHRLKIVHGVQTEVLLCQYFLHKGRLVEAQYHLSLAVSFVVIGNLSAIRSSRCSRASRLSIDISPRDCIDEGELILGFWTVYSLDKIWSSTLNFLSNFAPEISADVDTPWPLEMDEYVRNQLPQQFQSAHTIQRFINDLPDDGGGISCLAVLAKSAVLLSRATTVAQQWRSNMSPAETAAFLQPFTKLNNRIKKFRDSLPPPNSFAGCPAAVKPAIILAHTIAHAATIQLNRSFAAINPPCRKLCLRACRSIFWIIRAVGFKDVTYINPIIGAIWLATGQVLAEEITRLRTDIKAAAVAADLISAYDEIIASIALFAKSCPFMRASRFFKTLACP
ncbi:hypothetical protein DFH07DRAFT_911117 [Mycena maculata]|uniref:Zn(2)-C6 fungal-type domain-containing protein n=1 Tax=Mycena maculata TaxID=230809 RepID=A0AAD7K5H6_9AGAR|nr:hypothetical protein DFH07DRAFT_911117 [Mycena maculata]